MKFIVMSDLHLSKKPWQVRKALNMGKGADAVLLAGDLTNDGTPEQLQLMQQCIEECLPDTPVLAVTGNHDCPHQPSPMIRRGICDFPALQNWLLDRQPHPFCLDNSGAWAVRMGDVEVIGLNCVWHWRRFKFQDGAQLDWLQNQLNASDAQWHIILCHAPLLAHNPKRSDTKPYLSRDEKLQSIIDAHRNIIFISGHTHVSMENMFGCVEYDRARNNYYINDGSVRPTTLLDDQGRAVGDPAEGNVVEIDFYDDRPEITGISVETGKPLSGTIWGDGNWESPVTRAEVVGMLTDHYPEVTETFLQRENYTSSWGGMFFALNVGWDHLGRYGILAEFTLLHLERRFFRIHRFLTMMDAAKDRYIQAHPDQEQTAQALYDTLCSNLTERENSSMRNRKGPIQMIDITLLGTGGMYPLPDRALTSLYIRYDGRAILIDCGEGTQIQMRKYGLRFKPIEAIFITHFHADHMAGLPGLLLTLGNEGRTEPLTMYGPIGLEQTVNSLRAIFPELPYEIQFREFGMDTDAHLSVIGLDIDIFPADHSVDCLGYCFTLSRPGKFDPQAAKAKGIPQKLWGRLQKGESVEGFTPADVLGAPRKSIRILYCTDTRPVPGIEIHGADADLLILEGMFGEQEKQARAEISHHMMMQEAAQIAAKANARELWLTHYSPATPEPELFEAELKGIFANTVIAKDGQTTILQFRD